MELELVVASPKSRRYAFASRARARSTETEHRFAAVDGDRFPLVIGDAADIGDVPHAGDEAAGSGCGDAVVFCGGHVCAPIRLL